MSGYVLAIRPQPGLDDTLRTGEALGLPMRGMPLSEICPVAWQAPDPDGFDALLIGSANAIRHGGAALGRYRHLPVHAVGATTAAVASEAGFTVEQTGEGGLQQLLDAHGGPRRYLRLGGLERVPLTPPAGSTIEERVVYQSVTRNGDPGTIGGARLVLLHSAAAARQFHDECIRCDIDPAALRIACLGPRIAEAAGLGWGEVGIADQPNDAALLALAQDMCH